MKSCYPQCQHSFCIPIERIFALRYCNLPLPFQPFLLLFLAKRCIAMDRTVGVFGNGVFVLLGNGGGELKHAAIPGCMSSSTTPHVKHSGATNECDFASFAAYFVLVGTLGAAPSRNMLVAYFASGLPSFQRQVSKASNLAKPVLWLEPATRGDRTHFCQLQLNFVNTSPTHAVPADHNSGSSNAHATCPNSKGDLCVGFMGPPP
jgi:hypothetical protein